jgi:hypothetical protein
LGDIFHCDHATVLHAKKRIAGHLDWDKVLRQELSELEAIIDHSTKVIEGKLDIRNDYEYIDLNECVATKRMDGKSIIFVGYSEEEINKLEELIKHESLALISFHQTGMFLLKKNEPPAPPQEEPINENEGEKSSNIEKEKLK